MKFCIGRVLRLCVSNVQLSWKVFIHVRGVT